jgi:hypothetical protein
MNRRDQILKKRGHSRRLLSVLLALVMLLSLLPTAVFADTTPKATLITDASTLKAGDQIILAASANGKTYAAGSLSGKLLTSIETNPTDPADTVEIFTLGGEAGKWTLTASDGKQIYTADAKALNNTGKGTGTWTIAIDDSGLATVASTDSACGRILYNVKSPRFLNYTSATNVSMLLPSIYRLEVSSARQSGIVTDLTTLRDGDKVVVFNPSVKKAMSATAVATYYRAGVDVTLDSANKLTGYGDTELWTLGIKDGKYTFTTADGKKLSMGASYSSIPLDDVNTEWTITSAATEGCFYIKNVVRGNALQWYADKGNFSSKASISTTDEALFAQQLYLVIDSGSETPDPEPGPTALIKDGKYVIYNPGSGKAMSADATGTYYRAGKDVTVTNGKVTDPAEDLIWTVTSENGVYTITTSDGKKLSMNADRNSLPLDEVNDTWKVEKAKTDGCFYLINANRPTYYVEWFAKYTEFTTYTYKASDESVYALQFIPVDQPLVADGKYVIYNPGSGKAMSANATGTYYRAGKDVTVTNGKVDNPSADLIWTVSSTDGVYTITTSDGKKLSMNADRNSLPLNEVNDTWKVEKATTDGCFYLINANRPTYYVEWFAKYTEFTTYTYKASDESVYALQFIPVSGSDQPSGGLPTVGDQVVIYNANAGAALAKQDDNPDSPSITKAVATIADGKLTAGNGAVIFTVEANGEYLRFRNETYGYLCAGGTGNNAFYSATASEDADWLVRTCSGGVGGYELESRTAKYKGHSQWLEYYSDSFKVYSMYNVTDYTIYSFFFYPVAEGTKTVDGVVNNPAVVLGDLPYAYVGTDYSFTFTVDAPFGVQGDMTAKLNGTSLSVTLGEDGTYTVTIPAASVTGDKLTVNISGTDNKYIPISAAAEITVKDEPVFADPTPARGSQTGKNKRPAISVALANAGEAPTITMTVNGTAVTPEYAGGRVTYTPAADMADGRTEVKVTATRADGKSAEFSWFFTVGKTTYQLYFGQLHGHTQYSDGAGSLDSALSYIKNLPDSANVQFVAFTDHSNYFDPKNDPNVEAALYDTSLVKDSDANHSWKTYKDTIAQFNKDNAGDMVAIGGFEMTWSGGPGHINTFNTPGIVSRNNKTLNNKTDDAGMKAYYALLSQTEGANSISQFNHPGTTFGNFKDFSYWNPVIDSRMYMVEVGNGEGQIGAGGYYPSYEQYIMALDKGWHLAPTNNQDNHQGKWGNANDARDVILTDNFTEEGIYNAIRALRMYATEDKNLELGYTVNGLMMGSSIKTVPGKLDIEVSVYDPDRTDSIAKVEVVVNSGKVAHVWDDPAEFKSGTLSVTLAPEYSYYFIRVTQKDGDLAVTSPVWVGESLKLGISNLVCGTATPVTDEELTLTTTLFNSENADATVTSLVYSINGKVIGTDTAGYTIAAGSTLDIPFKWTPDQARVATVLVTAVVNQNNKDYTFTKTISLDVLDASKLVYIGIDASHYNEYVNGNYKDSMGNFGNLAAEYSVRTVQLNTSADLIAACSNPKYKAMVLTAPSRRSPEAQADPKTYSQEELAALTAFNDAGGTVILAGWSDNYENYDVIQNNPNTKHMAETQNDVLKTLGSSLRISDDATYDDVRSAADGVDKWRLYFSDYNMDNFLTDGVIVDTNHPYDKMYTERFSHYGGASIYAVDAAGNPTSTLPATVSPVVYGHASTYSVDVDKDGRGGAGIPKYTYAENDPRLLIMATEQLEGKGMVIVSGAAFLSNFEVQSDLDNTLEKNYSNYRICENLINYLNPPKISTIAEVHADPDEGIKYTVEGIVTSNASGYDKNTAFFDCIYIQDETGGINCFPVAGDYQIGDKLRISGSTSSYQGERQLAVTKIRKLGADTPVEPKVVTAAQVNDGSVLGQLITLKGYVTGIEMANGLIQTILVRDAQGNVARVFIDGYITTSQDVANAAVGCEIEATGLASYDNTFVLEDGTPMAPRIRTRDRADIICTAHTHAFGDWEETTPATCTKDGVKTRTCACGETETQTIPATGHTFGDWEETTPATCTADGVETRTCSACGETETRAIPATGHSFGEWTVTAPATCTVDGMETRTCSACGETETRTIPATGHTFGDWTVTTPATCTADGVETRSCACGETETRAIPATGHVDADNDGKCDVCQTVLTPVNPGDPDNPTPDNPDKPTPDTPDKPATGDNSAMVLWVSVMSITVLAGAALIRSKKRRV